MAPETTAEKLRPAKVITGESEFFKACLSKTSLFESPSEGFEGKNFYNVGVNVETHKEASEVIDILHQIEDSLGRNRAMPKFSSRIIDLDLVLYDDMIDEAINVPRKDILRYAFVLAPLLELNPDGIHPEKGVSFLKLWKDFESVNVFELQKYNIDQLYN